MRLHALLLIILGTLAAFGHAHNVFEEPVLGVVYDLTDLNFDGAVNTSEHEWFVDVYAPWQVYSLIKKIIRNIMQLHRVLTLYPLNGCFTGVQLAASLNPFGSSWRWTLPGMESMLAR